MSDYDQELGIAVSQSRCCKQAARSEIETLLPGARILRCDLAG